MSARNKATGPWVLDREQTVQGDSGEWTIITEQADMLDTKLGTTYIGGAYRVRVEGPGPAPRTKTFLGETAWSDAERLAYDHIIGLRYGRIPS